MVALPDGLQIGDVVAGKYEILRVIGSGAMGVVVAAHHLNLDRTVALKFLVAEALAHPDALARFAFEARAPAKIENPHVVRVHDVAFLPSGTPYIELEYLEGGDLAERLRAFGRLPVDLAVDFVLQACSGLAAAHALGIIHRDLKPANLFVVRSPNGAQAIKVLDFGVSKAKAGLSETLRPGAVRPLGSGTSGGPIGSPSYMSPEQMESSPDIDFRTDIWSLGVTLCELVSGELPFRGQSLVELYYEVKSRQPLSLRSRRPDLPAGLEVVISRCLQFDRQLRFSSVAELARALRPFAPDRAGIDLGPARSASAPSIGVDSSSGPLVETRVSAGPAPLILSRQSSSTPGATTPVAQRILRAAPIVLAACAAVLTTITWVSSRRPGAFPAAGEVAGSVLAAAAAASATQAPAVLPSRPAEPAPSAAADPPVASAQPQSAPRHEAGAALGPSEAVTPPPIARPIGPAPRAGHDAASRPSASRDDAAAASGDRDPLSLPAPPPSGEAPAAAPLRVGSGAPPVPFASPESSLELQNRE